jgi:hypothetical protein
MTAHYDIHGVGVAVRGEHDGVGEALERRLRQFAVPGGGHAEIELRFDDQPIAPAPEGPSRCVYETRDGDLHYFPEDDVLAADLRGVRLHVDGLLGRAHISSERFTGRARYVAAHPLSTLALIELLRRHDRFNLHAACVARDGAGLLLAGPSGTGKSTLALALARTELDYLGDDMLFLAREDDGVIVHGFCDAVGVTAPTRERFHELADAEPESGFPKSLVRIEEAFDTRVAGRCRPRALVFPEIAGTPDSTLEPLDAQEAFMRLLPDVLLTEPGTSRAHVATIAALTAQVDCYRLRTGTDVDAAAAKIAELV